MNELSRYFRRRIDELGFNYSQLARTTGISSVYVMKIIKGERIPSDAVIGKISRALGLDPRKALFYAHKDKAPEEFRDLFQLPEPKFPIIRGKLYELFEGSLGDLRRIFEVEPLGVVERALVGLFARIVADRALVDEDFKSRHVISGDFLKWLEWAEADFGRLEDELSYPLRQRYFCEAMGEVVRSWDFTHDEDTVRVKLGDGREGDYKFCLLETSKFRRELVLDSVKTRTMGKEKGKTIRDGHTLSKEPSASGAITGSGMALEKYMLDRLRDDVFRDFLMKAAELPREDIDEMRDIAAIKIKRSLRRTREK